MFETSIPAFLRNAQHEIWIGIAGAMLVLLQSVLSGTRRVWWRLAASCIIGGVASALTGHIFADSKWVYFFCGIAAIVAENVIFGLFNASEDFKNNPINVFGQLWRLVMPSFGRGADQAAQIEAITREDRKAPPADQPVG